MISKAQNFARLSFWCGLMLTALASVAVGQSTDVAWPAPVRTSEVRAIIPARDLGDPRVTDHYYAFTATPGDVLITVDSKNLNGDIDVFTFSGLRPLLKITVYAGSSSPVTKGIYLRQQEDLILRVEGRTPDDDEASYRIQFSGSFEPITSGPLAEHEDALAAAAPAETTNSGGRRVSSVGARIEEPHTEVAAAPTPEPTPAATPESEPKTTAARPAPRNRRRVPTTRRQPRPEKPPATADETAAKKDREERSPADSSSNEPAPAPKPTRRGRGARKPPPPVAAAEPEDSGPRLLIETSDGTLVDRFMGTVRRVTIENGQVIVIGKDGTIQRIPLATVVRMTIAP